MKKAFPKDFLWGSASAAYQIEGAASIDGKGPSIWDIYSKTPGNTLKNTNGDVAIDFYHRYKEDIKTMAEMGLTAYRFSVSWPRILPEGKGEVNPKGIQFYHDVIDELLKYGIEPVLTIYHWDLPQALQDEYDGFESRQIVDDFVEYAKVLFKEYGSKVKYWVTMNEQNVFTGMGYLYQMHPPKKADFIAFLKANHHAFLANALAINAFREMVPNGLIGPSFAFGPDYALTCAPSDVLAAANATEIFEYFWMDVYARGEYPTIAKALLRQLGVELPIELGDEEVLKLGKPDFMGVNYYQTKVFKAPDGKKIEKEKLDNQVNADAKESPFDKYFYATENPFLTKTDWGWTIDPVGLQLALREITSRYNLPILITENGLGAYDKLEDNQVHDEYRIEYLREHIKAIQAAITDGCEVLGYCTWSYQDLFSWLNGYAKRYGFIYVDRDEESEKELKRYKKDSFYWYKSVIESNGEEL